MKNSGLEKIWARFSVDAPRLGDIFSSLLAIF